MSFNYDIFGAVAGALGLLGLIQLLYAIVQSQLPSHRLKVLQETHRQAQELFYDVYSKGLLSDPIFVKDVQLILADAETRIVQLKIDTHRTKTYMQELKEMIFGLSRGMSALCEELKHTCADISSWKSNSEKTKQLHQSSTSSPPIVGVRNNYMRSENTADTFRSTPVTFLPSPHPIATRDSSAPYRLPDTNSLHGDCPLVSLRHPAVFSSTVMEPDDPDPLCGGERVGQYCYHKCHVSSWSSTGIPTVIEMSGFASDKRWMANPRQFPTILPSILHGISYTGMPFTRALPRRSSSIWMPRCGLWDKEFSRRSRTDTICGRTLEEGFYESPKPSDSLVLKDSANVSSDTTPKSSFIQALACRWMGTTPFERVRRGQLPIHRA